MTAAQVQPSRRASLLKKAGRVSLPRIEKHGRLYQQMMATPEDQRDADFWDEYRKQFRRWENARLDDYLRGTVFYDPFRARKNKPYTRRMPI